MSRADTASPSTTTHQRDLNNLGWVCREKEREREGHRDTVSTPLQTLLGPTEKAHCACSIGLKRAWTRLGFYLTGFCIGWRGRKGGVGVVLKQY